MTSTPAGVVVIPNDDTQQSEGVDGATEQPVAPTFPSIPTPSVSLVSTRHSPVKGSSGPGLVPVPLGGVSGDSSAESPVFVPSCDLRNDSRLSVRNNALEFYRHAFPLASVGDMEAMGNPALAHNMAYAAAQPCFTSSRVPFVFMLLARWRPPTLLVGHA